MAPEQIRGTPAVSHKTDLYALGFVLYQMLTGQPPFEGQSAVVLMHRHLNEPPPRAQRQDPRHPPGARRPGRRLMAKAATTAPGTPTAVAHALCELRDKAERGEPSRWSRPDGASDPTGATTDRRVRRGPALPEAKHASLPQVHAAKPIGPRRTLGPEGRRLETATASSWPWSPARGFVGYMLWPPGHGVPLPQGRGRCMATSGADRTGSSPANDYIDRARPPVPRPPYKEQTRAWRDEIAPGRPVERAAGMPREARADARSHQARRRADEER